MKSLKLLLLSVLFVFTLTACNSSDVSADSYYVSVDINPSIEFIVDQDDIIVSYQLLNEDAEIIAAQVDFVGMNVDDAVELFIELATEAGYIDVTTDDNAVLITVLGTQDDSDIETIRERIRERIGRYFIRNYITGEILTEDFTEEDLVQQAQELGVTPGKLALATLIIQTDTEESYTLEELLDTPVKDLVSIVRTYHEEAIKEYTEERISELQEKHEERMNEYKERFDQWVENHPNLTEDEINALWDLYEQRIHRINRERWQERIDQWKERQQEIPEQPNTTDTSDTA